MSDNVLQVIDLKKNYVSRSETVEALKGVSFEIKRGQIIALMGPSGSGKTTMLNLIGCMDKPTSGTVIIEDHDISKTSNVEMIDIRRDHLGFVFQDNHLIPTLTAVENVNLPIMFSGKKQDGLAQKLLEKVGLGDRLKHRPSQLSGGQNQRVAIARALINQPDIILADEPTGRLDVENKAEVFNLFRKLVSDGVAILLATHDTEIAKLCDKVLVLRDGRLVSQ